MKNDKFQEAVDRAFGSTLGAMTFPTDEQIRAIGEHVAAEVLKSDPAIESAEYDHATQSIRVRFTAEASGFPLKVTIDEDLVKS